MNWVAAAVIAFAALVAPGSASAHRLDEYLQGTMIAIGKNEVRAEMTLTPGVAVAGVVLSAIDSNHDGVISQMEQRAYAARVVADVSLAIDGHPLSPRLLAFEFPAAEEMKAGRGEIRLRFLAELPVEQGSRSLTLENYHQAGISVYQVNCLVSQDPAIQIVTQKRNYVQSRYRLDYTQTASDSDSARFGSWGSGALVGLAALGLMFRLVSKT